MNNVSFKGFVCTDSSGSAYLLVDEAGFPTNQWLPADEHGLSKQILDVEAPAHLGDTGTIIYRDNLNGVNCFAKPEELGLKLKGIYI